MKKLQYENEGVTCNDCDRYKHSRCHDNTFSLYDNLSEQQEERFEKLRLLQQNKYYQKQFELMKTSLKSTRSFKHDMKNHLAVLKL